MFYFLKISFALVMALVHGVTPIEFRVGDKHPLEDKKSWYLNVARHDKEERSAKLDTAIGHVKVRRSLEHTSKIPIGNGEELPYTIRHKKPKKHIPFAGGDTTHGIMIDAGSQGTRLHIYEWDKRFLLDEDDLLEVAHGKKLSFPTSNSRWTDKYTPGMDVFSYHKEHDELKSAIGDYLGALLDFARHVLKDQEDQWETFPIYLKATGGLRTLPQTERVRILSCVRELFHEKSFNPFAFLDERARVISGEEEAIYGWVGVNFAKGLLIDQSEGVGLGNNPQLTYGMLEMGGASTQIAVYENNGDLMANLFKLQLGGARHWNVYVHSYLYSGINGAWSRLNARLNWEGTTTNPCLPIGSSQEFSSWMHLNNKAQIHARSDPESTPYTITIENNEESFDFQRCSNLSYSLLRKQTNEEWCDFQMDGNCGYAGIYQPPMPQVNRDIDEFVATSNFVDVFEFLKLGERSTIDNIQVAAERVCNLSFEELKIYNEGLESPLKDDDVLAQYCFRSVFVYQMLRNGWEFGGDYEINAVDVINGQKLGWALGCMLYEINTLPWDFHPELLYRGPSWWLVSLYIVLGILGGSAIGFMLAMRMSKKFNKRVRESKFFRQTGLGDNDFFRKSMALPDIRDSLEELEKLYEEDEKQAANEEQALKAKQNSSNPNYNT